MDESSDGRIVVGIDGTNGSRAALAFALGEGMIRGVPVEAVTTWLAGPPMRDTVTEAELLAEQATARSLQDSVIDAVLPTIPGAAEPIRTVLHDVGGAGLLDAAANASMLVVGTGRRGLLARAFLGSVSEFCVRHAAVPVVVVPDPGSLTTTKRASALAG